MHGLNTHPIERFLHRLAESIWRHPRWFVFPQLVIFALAIGYAAVCLKFKTDTNDLVSSDVAYQRHWQELKREFHVQEDLVTLVESEDREKNRQFVERLAARLEAETNLFCDIFYKGDVRAMGPKALLLLSEDRLAEILKALRNYQPLVRRFSDVTNLNSLFTEVETQWRAAAQAGTNGHLFAQAVPALTRIVEQGAESLQRAGVPPSPGVTTLFAGSDGAAAGGYLQFAGGRFYIITCAALEEPLQDAAIARLRQLVDATRAEVPGVNAGVTGEPVLRLDEMEQAEKDTTRASLVALVIVALTFIYCYHQIRRPLMATACLIVGIGYTLGFATLTVGQLNILTITFVPILIGMAIDFGVHLIARFEEELREGRTERAAMHKALVATGTGILTSGLTTAAAFLAMMFTGFKGIREMGLISGGGLLVCLVPMMTLLPAMLLLRRCPVWERATPSARRAWHCRREQLEQVWLKRPRVVLAAGGLVTVLALTVIYRLSFDYNLLHMQSPALPAVILEQRLEKSASHSILSCAVTANSLPEALALEKRIRALPSVADVDSVAPFLAGNQTRKQELVREISTVANEIDFAPMDEAPVNPAVLDETLRNFGRAVVGALQFMGQDMDERLKQQLIGLREAVGRWRDAIASMPPDRSAAQMTLYQRALFSDLDSTLTALQEQDYREPLRVENLPPGVRSRFVGRTGKFLLQIYPRKNVWEHEAQQAFVRELRTIDPAVTGSPVRFYETTRQLKRNFQIAAVDAVVVIALMLLVHFRNAACVVLALIPVVLGVLWTGGFMVLFHLPFNPANIIAPTLLIGIGVANGIHILNRFIEEKTPTILGKSTGKAVLVSALTTATGFGSLMLAQHAGIASLGVVMALGTALCMLASVTVLPALLILLNRTGWKLAHGWLKHGG